MEVNVDVSRWWCMQVMHRKSCSVPGNVKNIFININIKCEEKFCIHHPIMNLDNNIYNDKQEDKLC